jgi:hypothetical protein
MTSADLFLGSMSVRPKFTIMCFLALMFVFALPGLGQSSVDQNSTTAQETGHSKKKGRGPGKEIGKGGEDIAKGAAEGSVDLAKGTAGGVGNLATGHPVDAAASVGKGAGGFGKHVGVGTGKGVAKIGKGVGGGFKKLGHKSSKRGQKTDRAK